MRICLVSGEYPPMQGGVGDYTRCLAGALSDLGVRVAVVTSAQAGMGPDVDRWDVHPVVERWGWHCWSEVTSWAGEADVLHIQYQTAAYGMHPAVNFLPLRLRLSGHRPKVAVTYHDLKVPYLFPKAGRLRWWVTLALARWSEATIVTNAEDYSRMSEYPFVVPLTAVPIGSNISPCPPAGYDRQRWRERLGVRPDDFLLSYFGFLNESKGGETLIRALDGLVRDGYNTHLLMVGGQVGDSDPTNVTYFEGVKALIERLGLGGRVGWTGFTPADEVSANLLASDACVLPYRGGASLRRGSLMAALAHGLPVVSTQGPLGGTGEVDLPRLTHGESALLVPPEDPQAVAGAVSRLIESRDLRERLGAGAQRLSRAFAWERVGQQTVQVYRKMMEEENGG